MNKYRRKTKRNPKPKSRMKFWEAVRKIGFKRAFRYELRHPPKYPKYPIWFIPMLISMAALAILLFFIPIGYLPILFYILEIIIIFYMVFRVLKRLNMIRIHGDLMRLYGLRLLSGLITALGFIILFVPAVLGFSALIFSPFSDQSFIVNILTFGTQWQCPFFVSILINGFGIGLIVIGAYLLFKFKMKTGNVIWVGKF